MAALLVGLLVLALAWTGLADRVAETQTRQMLTRALMTFATARSLNAVISIIKETELAIQPAGVGATLAPGQILDPVDDLVEQFSWLMLLASVSLGVQALLLEISQWIGAGLVLTGAIMVWWLSLAWPSGASFGVLARRVVLLVLFLRFAAPLAALGADAVYQLFVDPGYRQANAAIEQTHDDLLRTYQSESEAMLGDAGESGSVFGRWWNRAMENLRLGERLASYRALFSDFAETLVRLIVVFVVQTIVLPIAFLWLLMRLWRACWS